MLAAVLGHPRFCEVRDLELVRGGAAALLGEKEHRFGEPSRIGQRLAAHPGPRLARQGFDTGAGSGASTLVGSASRARARG